MRNSGGIPQGTIKAQRAPLGAGGWLRAGVYITNAGDVLTGGDTNGVWIRPNGSTSFLDLMNTNALPAGNYEASVADGTIEGSKFGAQFIAIAPSNGNYGIFAFNNNIYKVANLLSASPTATKIGGPYANTTFSANTASCLAWRKAVFDPQNPDVVLIGTQTNLLYYSTNFTTTATLTAITVDTPSSYGGYPGYHLVACDPSSSVVGGIKQIWYYATYGVGVKRSTTGPNGTYILVTGSPTNVRSLKVDAAGNVFAINAGESTAGNLYKATQAGNFAKVSGLPNYEFGDVAINPAVVNGAANNQIVLIINPSGGFGFAQSIDGGATWIGADVWLKAYPAPYGLSLTCQNLGWMQPRNAQGASAPGIVRGWSPGAGGNIEFHPSNGTLYMASGAGMFKSTPPTTRVEWWWTEDTLGVEQLVVTDVFTPSGGKPIYSAGDFALFKVYDDTYAGTKSTIPQMPGGTAQQLGDETAWAVESAPGNPAFLATCCGYWGNAHAYSQDRGDTWTVFPGTFPLSGTVYNGGVILPQSTTDFYGFFGQNLRPCSLHSLTGNWAYEDVNMPGMHTTGRVYYGSGNAQLIVDSVANWDTTQNYVVTIAAASGAGSVVDNAGAKTVTVTPPTGATTAAQIAAQITAGSALVKATYGGTGAGTVAAGTLSAISFESGWGWYPYSYVGSTRTACLDKTNGDIYAYNYGDGTIGVSASWAGIWKRTASTGLWSKVAGAPGGIFSTAVLQLREIIGQQGHMLFHGQAGTTALYRTTNGWQTSSQVGNGTQFFTNVWWAHAGAAAPNQSYPAVYVYGTLNGVTAMFACFDGSWTNWAQYGGAYPGNSVYQIQKFAAHPDIFGRLDIAFTRGGAAFGTYDKAISLT